MPGSPFSISIPSNPATPATLFIAFGGAKSPADTSTMTIDATLITASLGRTIVGVPAVTCEALTIANVAQNQTLTSFQVGGGTEGASYGITWTAIFDDGSTLTRTIWLLVASQSLCTIGETIIAKGDPGPYAVGVTLNSQGQIVFALSDGSSVPGFSFSAALAAAAEAIVIAQPFGTGIMLIATQNGEAAVISPLNLYYLIQPPDLDLAHTHNFNFLAIL